MSGPKRALKLILMAQMSSTWRTCLHALISPHLPPRYRGNVKHGGLTMLSGKSEPTSTVGLPQNCAGKYWGMSRDHECFSPWGRQFTRCPMHQFSRPRLWDWPRICGKNDQDIVTLMRHNAHLLIAERFLFGKTLGPRVSYLNVSTSRASKIKWPLSHRACASQRPAASPRAGAGASSSSY